MPVSAPHSDAKVVLDVSSAEDRLCAAAIRTFGSASRVALTSEDLACAPYVPNDRRALIRTCASGSLAILVRTVYAVGARESPAADFDRALAISARMRAAPFAGAPYGTAE